MPYKDPTKQKLAQHKSYLKHKDVVHAKSKQVHRMNKEFIKEYKRTHPCEKCGEADINCLEFHHRNSDEKLKGMGQIHVFFGLTKIKQEIAKCMVLCSNCHRKEHNHTTTTNNRMRTKNRAYIKTYKEQNPCTNCGETETVCLDFHHTQDKLFGLSDATTSFGLKRLTEEIEKCIILCANCHRKLHYSTTGS